MPDKPIEKLNGLAMLAKARGSSAHHKGTQATKSERQPPNKRARAYSHAGRRPLTFWLDSTLSAWLPPALRASLMAVPTLPTLTVFYSLFSVAALSIYILSALLIRSSGSALSPQDVSPLDSLSLDHLLSKVSSLRLSSSSISPEVLSMRIKNPVFSACLWSTDTEVAMISPWATKWTGPISLLVTTSAAPSSPQHTALLTRLRQLSDKTPSLKDTLSAHVLHLSPTADPQPNAFLNLARLLAPSPRVVLFPGNLSSAPPKDLYRTLLAQQPSSSSAMSQPTRTRARKRRPTVLTLRDRTSFPFAPLAPLVIPRDDATWCTERFFAGMSRDADWEECLWQVWLASFGDLDVRQVQPSATLSGHPPGFGQAGAGSLENPAAVKLHRRLVSKFRSETCALGVRRFAALRDPNSSPDTKRARWLKRVCRAWSS